MTSSGHVTSSGSCPMDRPWPHSSRLSIEPSHYITSFPRYLAPKLRQRLLRDDVINGRHLEFGETGSRSVRSAVPENPTIGSNTKSIGRSVAEIWPFETLNLMTSLMTSQGPDKFVKKNYFPQLGDHRVKISAQLNKNWRRRSILKKKCGQTIWQSDRATN